MVVYYLLLLLMPFTHVVNVGCLVLPCTLLLMRPVDISNRLLLLLLLLLANIFHWGVSLHMLVVSWWWLWCPPTLVHWTVDGFNHSTSMHVNPSFHHFLRVVRS